MLSVYFIGYGGHALYAEAMRPMIQEELGLNLVTIHEWNTADVKWELGTWLNELKKADIIICPTDPNKFPAKSQNKLTQALSLGKPVVCSPLDAYKAVEEKYPGCCLFASTPEEWKEKLTMLRDSAELREQMSIKAREACKDYHIDRIGEKWIKVIMNRDVVDIVIPVYTGTCLKMCLDSIKACTDVKYNIIVVNNGPNEETHKYLEQRSDIIYIKKGPLSFAQAVNEGIKAGKSQYVCVLNDDIIVSKGWLSELLRTCKQDPKIGAVGPLSNCDKGWLHNYDININGVQLLPGTNTIEQITPIIPGIYEYASPYTETLDQDWIAYYCILIPREVIDKVGLLNEEFINSGEDVDHCKRIKLMGYKIAQNYKSFCFHYGAVSRKGLEKVDFEKYHADDARTQGTLKKLWDKKSVMIFSGPSWEPWDFRTMETTGIGGSEVWQTWLSRELSKLGYRVTVFADTRQGQLMDGDVLWLPYTDYPRWVDQSWVDYAILSRTTDPLRFPLRAGRIYTQLHDIWMLSEKTQTYLDKVTKHCVLSDWHLDFASDYHKIPKGQMAVMSNGIDFARFDDIKVDRNPYRFHWSSSWDRGLDNVLYLWPFIKEQIPEAELHVFYGNLTWKASCMQKNDQEGLKKIADIEEAMKAPGMFNHGRKSQKELAVELCKSSLLLYPQWFSETYFITGVEAQYSGVPVICNQYAGVTTTFKHPKIGDTAIMLGNGDAWWPYTKEGREAFFSETVSILKDRNKWDAWSEKGRENAKRFSWENCALKWKELFDA